MSDKDIERLSSALSDRYHIDRELGQGGMATVYLADDLKHDRKVALKVLKPELAAVVGADRFIQEIKTTANLQHPHILPLFDSGEADGFLYYVMPYIEGESLREKLDRQGELPVAEAVRILRDITDALATAHAQNVVHRDIKPENVMLSDRHALVMDFGVGKAVSKATGQQQLTTTGLALGTPTYMAPEQAAADPNVDHRADIYALGIVAYELLTGHPPFTGATPQAVLVCHATRAPEPVTDHRPAVAPGLAELVMHCLEKKPADRWQTAEQVLQHLEILATSSGALRPTGTSAPALAHRQKRPALVGAGLVAGVLVLVAVAWLAVIGKGVREGSGEERIPIAVLVFESRRASEEEAYFSEGLADDINTQLSKIGGFAVKAHASARRLSRDEMSYAEIADQLDARYLVHGNWSRSGDTVRIAARLIDPATEDQIWVDNYTRAFTASGMFAVQRDVAEQVANALNVAVAPTEQAHLAAEPTASTEAYNAYQLGRFFWNQRTVEGLRRATQSFGEAIEQDSNFALAYSGLADCYSLLPLYLGAAASEVHGLAKDAALKAVELDEASAEAHTSLAAVLWWFDWDWAGAEREFKRALALNPRYPTVQQWYGGMLMALGRMDEGVAHMREALVLDNLSFVISRDVATALLAARRYEEALAQVLEALELDPRSGETRAVLVLTYLLNGMEEQALEEAERLADLGALAFVHAWRGDAEQARQLVSEAQSENFFSEVLFRLGTHGVLGDTMVVIQALERALDARSPLLAWYYGRIPPFDGIWHSEPFQPLLARLGLEEGR